MNLHIENRAAKITKPAPYLKRPTMSDNSQPARISMFAFSLDDTGVIRECDKSVEKIFGYSPHELVWQHISCLFPSLADVSLMQGHQVNQMLNYICHCDHHFEAFNKQSDIIVCNLSFVLVENEGGHNLRMIVRPVPNANT